MSDEEKLESLNSSAFLLQNKKAIPPLANLKRSGLIGLLKKDSLFGCTRLRVEEFS
jgi:hypothetical protein